MRRHRCPRAQQFFRQHEAREVAALGAAVFAWQRQAEPPALGKLAAEAGIKAHPGTRALVGLQAVQRVRQKGANLSAQGFVGVRNGAQFQRVDHGGEPKGWHARGGRIQRLSLSAQTGVQYYFQDF
ncbi:hypothetical protein D3C86_1597020 [compost metagenome]